MSENSQILVVTPGGSALQPAEPRIKCGEYSDLARAYAQAQPFTFDYWATAYISSRFKSDVILNAVDNSDGRSVLLLPLHGYEWIVEVGDLEPRLLALLPGIGVGVMMVGPAALRPDLSERGDATLRGALADFARQGTPVTIVAGTTPVAASLHDLSLPPLVPDFDDLDGWTAPYFDERWLSEVADTSSRGVALKAGILQMNARIDASHQLAQSIEGHPEGDYWHAIMHRRVPDYGNSKYWFRHVAKHPVFAPLADRAKAILQDTPAEIRTRWAPRLKVDSGWDPFAFVDMCEAAAGDEDNDLGMTARRIQWAEMLLLLKHTAGQIHP